VTPVEPTRSQDALDERARWELLLASVVTMAAGLSLDDLLSRIVTAASHLAGSRYAALGVIEDGPSGRLRTFIHHGMSPAQVVEIGELPTGHGLLGALVNHSEPLRIRDIAEHPASFGFPEHHPPMHSFLGVPVRTRDTVFGTLYLTEKEGPGDFTDQDQRIVVALAAAAGVAIENARLHEQAAQRERWLAATVEITARLASSSGHEALQVVADRAREVSGADVAWVVAGSDAGHLQVQVVAGAAVDIEAMAGLSLSHSLVREVATSGTTLVVADMATDARATTMSEIDGWPELGPAIVVPLGREAGIEGVLALAWTPARAAAHLSVNPNLPTSFAEQAALALQVLRSRDNKEQLAVLQDRDRIGRDLHDLVIQRLFAVGLGLQSSAKLVHEPELTERLSNAIDDLDMTISDIRRTIFALGSLGDAADLQAEVTRIVDRTAATLQFRPTLRFEGAVRTLISPEAAPEVLAVLGEALSNVTRHAAATRVDVCIAADQKITLEVIDNGVGIAPCVVESGLRNMRARAAKRGGTCTIEPAAGGGTRVFWVVPLG
jgi:signal transduction histidine kinase